MPGKSWRDKIARPAKPDVSNTSGFAAPATNNMAVDPSRIEPQALSPRLAALMKEREALEQKMHKLVNGDGENSRYRVPSPLERREEYRRFEQSRDKRINAEGLSNQAAIFRQGKALTSAPRTSLTDFLRKNNSPEPLPLEPLARPTAKPLAPIATIKAREKASLRPQLGGVVSDTNNRSSMTKCNQETLKSKQQKNDDGHAKPTSTLSNTLGNNLKSKPITLNVTRHEDGKITLRGSDAFEAKRQALREELAATKKYRDTSQRKLDIDTGGSGELGLQSEKSREKALTQRKALRDQELKDEARRLRALLKKKEK